MENFKILDLRESYYKVSNRIYDESLNIDVYELGVYNCLCRFANNENTESYPSITKIQQMLKISRPKVVSATKSLIEKELILKKQGHSGKSNRYYLMPIPSKRELLVNAINQGSKPGELGVVNEVNPIKTKLIKTKEENIEAVKEGDPVTEIFDIIYNFHKERNTLPISQKDKVIFYKHAKVHIANILKENPPSSAAPPLEVFKWAVEDEFWSTTHILPSMWPKISSAYQKKEKEKNTYYELGCACYKGEDGKSYRKSDGAWRDRNPSVWRNAKGEQVS